MGFASWVRAAFRPIAVFYRALPLAIQVAPWVFSSLPEALVIQTLYKQ